MTATVELAEIRAGLAVFASMIRLKMMDLPPVLIVRAK